MYIYNDHQLYSIIGPNSYYSHTTETIHELVTADNYDILQQSSMICCWIFSPINEIISFWVVFDI